MFQSRIARIALAVFLVIALAVVAYFLFFAKKSEESASDIAKTTVPDDQYAGSGTLPAYSPVSTRSATGSTGSPDILPSQSALAPTALPTAQTTTPYPGSGVFDWTHTESQKEPSVFDKIEPTFTTKQVEQIKSNDICGLSGISNSWSDPFEKIVCDITEFTAFKIIEPLRELACQFAVAALQLNYDQNIKSESSTGECRIIDR